MINRSRIGVLAAAVAVAQGCSSTFTQTEHVTLDNGFRATQAAMADLEFSVKEQSKDALQARIVAEQADRTDVAVHLARTSAHITEFRIKVGLLGDNAQARMILDKIRERF
jgi:hypothetical protein